MSEVQLIEVIIPGQPAVVEIVSRGLQGIPGPARPPGGSDVMTNTDTSVDGEAVIFSGTGGKTLKRATGSGMTKLTAGILGTATIDTDYLSPTSHIDGGTFT